MTTTSSTAIAGTINQTSSGRTYITGAVTGLDTNSLIESAVNAKLTKYNTIEDTISTNGYKISALQYLQSYAQSMQTALANLKSTTDSDGNTLTSKTATFTTSDGSTSSSLATAAVTSSALSGTHSLVISQLAKAQSVTSDAQSSKSTALGYSGTFDIALDGKTATTITVTADMSLADIQQAINNATGTSGVSADIAAVGTDQYKLVLTGTSTAKDISISNVTGDDVMQSLGITDSSGDFQHISQASQQAIFSLDGTTVYSDSNTVSNVLTGVTLNLANANPDVTLTMDIEPNTSGIKEAIQSFITAYNTLRSFIDSQQSVDTTTGEIDSNAVLYHESVLRDLKSDITSMLSSSYGSGTISALGALGISINSDNQLEISDEDTLDNALENNLSSVQSLFATQFSSSSANLTLSDNTSSVSGPFTIDITTDGNGTITDASVGGDNSLFTISGNKLIGKAGTAYEGLTLSYAGTNSASVTVTLKQGLGDALYNRLEDYADSDTGSIATRITDLTDNNTDLTSEASDLYDAAETYREQLIDKYAAMETAALNAQILKQQIQAILNGSTSSSSS